MVGNKKTLYIEDDVLKDLEQDTFGHKHIADAIVNSILNTKPPFTIGIFGGWGTGKSSLLEIINSTLSKKVATVTIDAWRYSSADNLRRAFLVHVANELTPNLLDELRRKLFSSEQEILPSEPSKVGPHESFLKKIGNSISLIFQLASKFVGLFILFAVVLFLVFATIIVIQNSGFQDFWNSFDWTNFQERFLELAFIPLLLAIIDDVRLYIIQRPVTITHERIDADELFSYYFDRVVKNATTGPFAKKRLIIFIDNLDRLTDHKIVEALESLKTYLNNDKCVFVVACDDNVVRNVINRSLSMSKIENNRGDGRAGEHYLDKFFQQTFRLPEYMRINLQDFAEQNFRTTMLCDELKVQKVDIRFLISVILPSDVSSPRKVKRLLNEFIALYEIVKRREGENDGQLKPGLLTGNTEFLGKFSTIRAEYPSFYNALVENTNFLTAITNILNENSEEATKELEKLDIARPESLKAYLRKTQTIMVDDVEPYIWLSQDALALGLKGNHLNLLRTALSNGEIEQVRALLRDSENKEYAILVARVASRIVAERLVGIEQQNGVKVLSFLLPDFDESIRPQIAHISASLIPNWSIDTFAASEILNVLRWAQRGGIETQRNKLINQILVKLENVELRQETFDGILKNADVVDKNGATGKVQAWLENLLSEAMQSVPKESKPDDVGLTDKIILNHQFGEWVILQVGEYANNDNVIDWYFSKGLTTYLFGRLLGAYNNLDAVYLNDPEIGKSIEQALSVISNRIKQGLKSNQFWEGILGLIEDSGDVNDIRYGYGRIQELHNHFPSNKTEEFLEGILTAIEDLIPTDDDDQKLGELVALAEEAVNLSFLLCRRKEQNLDKERLEKLPESISHLISVEQIKNIFVEFIEQFTKEFGKEDSEVFISGAVIAFNRSDENIDPLYDLVVRLDDYATQSHRESVAKKIDILVVKSTNEAIDQATKFIEKIGSNSNYYQELLKYAEQWLAMLGPDAPPVLISKFKLFSLLTKFGVIKADGLVQRAISLFPFGGNQEQLSIAVEGLEKIKQDISGTAGASLFQTIMAHADRLGSSRSKALGLVAEWIENVEESARNNFNSAVQTDFRNAPVEYLGILYEVWNDLTSEQIKNQILQFYTLDLDSQIHSTRDKCTIKGLGAMGRTERPSIIQEIWSQLIDQNKYAEAFMDSAKGYLPIDELLELRQNAIDLIRANGASPQSEKALRLLAATVREDTRDIMSTVDLFVNLFGRGPDDVQLALKYVVLCLRPLGLRNDHKHKLAEAMSQAASRSDEEVDNIIDKANQLGLMWFTYRKYWKNKL